MREVRLVDPRDFELPAGAAELLHPLHVIGRTSERRRFRDQRAALYGGKAAKLAELGEAGFPVPPGWVLDAKYFRKVVDERLPRGHDIASLVKLAGSTSGTDRAARARDRILGDPLPGELSEALDALATVLERSAPRGASVRSSATCEDARTSSLAGLATSVLGVRGARGLEEALRQVWASLYLPRTLSYLHRWCYKDVAMSVLFMPMVVARAAGVMFTGPPPGVHDPRWREGERLIHASYGLGAAIVDGAGVFDSFRLSQGGALLDRVVAHKAERLVCGPEGGVHAEPVDAHEASEPSIGEGVLAELAALAERLEKTERAACDVEFAVERRGGADRVVLLQARPLTGGLLPEGGDENTVWSRANIGEALPGAATPLTWSVAKRFSERGFRAAFGALGCAVPREAVLVSNVYGRFYLNLSAFMEIAGQVPGMSPRALLELSGGAAGDLVDELEIASKRAHKRGFVLRAGLHLPSLVRKQLGLPAEVASWESSAARQKRRLGELELSLLPDDALATTLGACFELLSSGGELMLHCASASLAANVALAATSQRLLRTVDGRGRQDEGANGLREGARLARALSSGIAELESTKPGVALMHVAALARTEPEALEAIVFGGARAPTDLPRSLTRAALDELLERHGDRAVREAELATPRWREDPSELFAMLRSALRAPPIDPEAGATRARAIADRELARLEQHARPIELALVRFLVARTQELTRLRERMRAWVTSALGLVRRVALEIDERMRRIDSTLEPGSVFFCTYDELVASLRAGRVELSQVIRLRRAEHLRDRARPDPPATFKGRPAPVSLPPSSGARLVGLPASPGVVEGLARVLGPGADASSALEAGEILVSRTTDVGLSPLFLIAAGVVTELGGPLSHAAIVAREYGVPAVVDVEGATSSIQTGERLRIDGDRGVVERLDVVATTSSVLGARPTT